VLEVGGGIGEIQIELLERGTAPTVNLELSSAYDPEAKRLLRQAGLEERAERRLHDIAVEPDAVEPADVVVLHRVVCCYPDLSGCWERRPSLLGVSSCSAAGRTTPSSVCSSPPRTSSSPDRDVAGAASDGAAIPDLHHERVAEEDRVDVLERVCPPLADVAEDCLGDPAHQIVADLNPVRLAQVRLDGADAHPARIHGDDPVVEACEAAPVLRHDLRLEAPAAIARLLDP
jgi:hypothetical protein